MKKIFIVIISLKAIFAMNRDRTVFKGLNQRDFGILARHAEIFNLKKGDFAVRENDMGESIFMIIDGSLQIQKRNAGKKPVLIGILKEGDIFGELSFVSRKPRGISVVAREASNLFMINQKILDVVGKDLQLFFYRRIAAVAKERLYTVERRDQELVTLNKGLMSQMFSQATEHVPGIESSVFIREVISKVPRLPVFALSLSGKLMKDDISSKEIAKEVRKDPSLAGMLLKTINSSYHGMAHKISDLHDAILYLGFSTVSQITIAEGMRRSLPDSPLFRRIHDHSQAISHISFEIAQHFNLSRPSEISTISILHDLGQIIIQLLKMKNPKVETLFDLIDSSQMGAMLLKSWELPDIISETVKYQSYPWFAMPDRIPEPVRGHVTILFLSHLCYEYFQGKTHLELPLSFFDVYLKVVKIKSQSLPEFAHNHILPGLIKKVKFLPDSFVDLLGEFSKRAGIPIS